MTGVSGAELHIASCVAFVKPDEMEGICRAISATKLAEIPRRDPAGKLVLLFEARNAKSVLDGIDAIRALPGVLAVHLAYQHIEDATALEEEHQP